MVEVACWGLVGGFEGFMGWSGGEGGECGVVGWGWCSDKQFFRQMSP